MSEKQNSIINLASTLHGQIASIVYRKEAKTKKACTDTIIKTSKFQVRVGINYANQAIVKEKHGTGQVERKGLPDSMEKLSNCVYRNKVTGRIYLGVCPTRNANSKKTTQWTINGVQVEFTTIESSLLASEKGKKETPDWLLLPIENIVSIKSGEKVEDRESDDFLEQIHPEELINC